jgi:hypothetical protein
MAAKKAEAPHLRIRIEPKLLTRLEKAREKNARTLTGEIVARLEASFQREDLGVLLDAAALRAAKLVFGRTSDTSVELHVPEAQILTEEVEEKLRDADDGITSDKKK